MANLIIAWYLLDATTPRRTIYGIFGVTEEPIKPELRLWRRIILLACAIAALISGIIVANATPENISGETPYSADITSPIAVFAGAFLAALGWMYTNFEREKTERASLTLQAIREQMYSEQLALTYRQMRAISDFYRSKNKMEQTECTPIAAMKTRIDALDDERRPDGRGSLTLAHATDQFLNSLNQLAFGVRQGHFDLRTIEMVLRPRFVRHAFLFFEYIKDETDARFCCQRKRWVAQKRTWEHFLWLVDKLDILMTDNVRIAKIILPPDHIIGAREGESLR